MTNPNNNKDNSMDRRDFVVLGAAAAATLASFALAGCAKKETPAPEPVVEAPIKEPEPIEVEPTVPAEPYITKETLDGLTTEDSKYFAPVQNDHEAKAKGRNQYVIQDPNTENVKLYTMDLPTDVDIVSVKKYEPIKEGEWGQTDATGIVINLGAVDIEEGEADANTPETQIYIFNKPDMQPAEFAASIETTPNFEDQNYTNTSADRFKDLWVQSMENAGLYVSLTWGTRSNGPGGMHNGERIGDFTAIENDNRAVDQNQFPSDNWGGECYFGGQSFLELSKPDTQTTSMMTYTFVSGGTLKGKIPNLNNASVRELVINYGKNANLQVASTEISGEYVLIDS